jgi:hypothetical protein
MNKEQEEKLLADVKAITDHMTMVDEVFAKAKLGLNMVLVFECGASGLYFPSDYVRNWGKPYGDGLGPDVCSETLQSDYDIAPPEPDRNVRSLDQIMHPLRVSRAQMDAHLVVADAAASNMAILDHKDEGLVSRAPILREKQMNNPISKIARLQGLSLAEAVWKVKKEGIFR